MQQRDISALKYQWAAGRRGTHADTAWKQSAGQQALVQARDGGALFGMAQGTWRGDICKEEGGPTGFADGGWWPGLCTKAMAKGCLTD